MLIVKLSNGLLKLPDWTSKTSFSYKESNKNVQALCPESKRQRLKTICATRWVERHDAILVFMELIEAVVACLEELTLVPGETGSKANQLVHVCTSFDFIYSCTVLEYPSALFLTVSKQLQSPTMDLAEVCSLIENVVSILEREMNQDSAIAEVYTKANQSLKLSDRQ